MDPQMDTLEIEKVQFIIPPTNGFRNVCYFCCEVCVALAVGSCLRDEDLSVQPCNRPGVRLLAISSRLLVQTMTTQLMSVSV